jgi:hypothetical protein
MESGGLVRQDSLSGIRLNSNQVTHILDDPSADKHEVGETLTSAALCSPVRLRPTVIHQNFQNNNDNNISRNSWDNNNNNSSSSSGSNQQQHELPSWVSPTRQRIPLSQSTINNRGGSLLSAPMYNLCLGGSYHNNVSGSNGGKYGDGSDSPNVQPETLSPTRLSPTRRSPVRTHHSHQQRDTQTPWRRHNNNNYNEEKNDGVDTRVEMDTGEERRRGADNEEIRSMRQRDIPGDARRLDNSENEIMSTRRPFQFMRNLG